MDLGKIPGLNSLAQMVTRRTSVFTPLLALNLIVLVFSVLVYWKADNLWVFVPWLALLVYSIYRHEVFAQKMPHMLSTESVQKFGMQLGATGDKNNIQSEEIIDISPSTTDTAPETTQATTQGRLNDTKGRKKK
jgi:hypothetical protein